MERPDAFSERLRRRLGEVEAGRARRSQEDEQAMRERENAHARFEEAAGPIHGLVIRPAVDELSRRFPNASLEHFRTPVGFLTQCRFAYTETFPASAKLLIGLEWDDARQHACVVYRLEIVPELFAFEKSDRLEISLDAPNAADVREWVEAKLLTFVDTYLQLESNPYYQSGNLHADPVCGMQVSAASASQRLVHDGKTFYFCSKLCQEKFAAEPGLYTAGKAGLGDGAGGGEGRARDG